MRILIYFVMAWKSAARKIDENCTILKWNHWPTNLMLHMHPTAGPQSDRDRTVYLSTVQTTNHQTTGDTILWMANQFISQLACSQLQPVWKKSAKCSSPTFRPYSCGMLLLTWANQWNLVAERGFTPRSQVAASNRVMFLQCASLLSA